MDKVAALFVETNGVYFGLSDVEPWDRQRDARTYAGPHPVIAHPPCARWGRYWFGGPTIVRQGRPYLKLGDDEGCFAAALSAVRRWGGVIEHPEGSHAWNHFGIPAPPREGGWISSGLFDGGWTCCVEQGWYGHRARKATWLYVHGIYPPPLKWGRPPGKFDIIDASAKGSRARQVKTGICQQMSKRKRAATPIEFRDVLIDIARTANASRKSVTQKTHGQPVDTAQSDLLEVHGRSADNKDLDDHGPPQSTPMSVVITAE